MIERLVLLEDGPLEGEYVEVNEEAKSIALPVRTNGGITAIYYDISWPDQTAKLRRE